MKSRYLAARHQEFTDRQAWGAAPVFAPESPLTVVFGTDEFRVDRRRGAINLPGHGWISCPAAAGLTGPLAWIGVRETSGGFEALLGRGDPYELGMPVVPYCLRPDLLQKSTRAQD